MPVNGFRSLLGAARENGWRAYLFDASNPLGFGRPGVNTWRRYGEDG